MRWTVETRESRSSIAYFSLFGNSAGRDEGLFKSINRLSIAGGFFHSPSFFPHKCQIKVLTRPKPSVNMQRIHSGNADAVNTSETMNSR